MSYMKFCVWGLARSLLLWKQTRKLRLKTKQHCRHIHFVYDITGRSSINEHINPRTYLSAPRWRRGLSLTAQLTNVNMNRKKTSSNTYSSFTCRLRSQRLLLRSLSLSMPRSFIRCTAWLVESSPRELQEFGKPINTHHINKTNAIARLGNNNKNNR